MVRLEAEKQSQIAQNPATAGGLLLAARQLILKLPRLPNPDNHQPHLAGD